MKMPHTFVHWCVHRQTVVACIKWKENRNNVIKWNVYAKK